VRRWLLIVVLGAHPAVAQVAEKAPVAEAADRTAEEEPRPAAGGPKFIGIPIPIYNPQLDFALGAIAMLTYPLDSEDRLSPPSSTSLFGLVASNESYMLGAGQRFYWDEDNNRGTVGFAIGHFNSDFYGTGDQTSADIAFPLGTTGVMMLAKYLRRVWNRLYLGGQYRYLHTDAVLEAPSEPPEELDTFTPIEESSRSSGAGALVEFDSRDNQFSATSGFYAPVATIFYAKALGGNVNHGAVEASVNWYRALHAKELILAARGNLQAAFGDTPEYLLPAIGKGADLRGYATGRYRDNIFMSAQAELRWYFWRGLGAVAFTGVGSTTSSVSQVFHGPVLPSYGAGIRYMLHRDERLVMRVDYGHGNEDGMFYFSVSEAF